MATAPTVRQTQVLVSTGASPVAGGFASAPLAGSLLLACTELANPAAWDPPAAATDADRWRVLGGIGSVGGAGIRLLWRTALASEPAAYAFSVRGTGGAVQLVEVAGGAPRWVQPGQSAQAQAAAIGAGGAGATATAPTPVTTFVSGPSLLLAFWGSAGAPTVANGIAPASGWTEEYEAAGAQLRLQLQKRAGDPATAYTPAATFVAATSIARLVVAVAIAAADDAGGGGPLGLNTWARGQPARFL